MPDSIWSCIQPLDREFNKAEVSMPDLVPIEEGSEPKLIRAWMDRRADGSPNMIAGRRQIPVSQAFDIWGGHFN